MRFPFYIARRYLFSKKSHNAINIISGISVAGVAFTTMALVCTLSVFNGFHQLVSSLFTAFDPELRISAVQGKVFSPTEKAVREVCTWKEVVVASETLEDHAMVEYNGHQIMATVKGVADNYRELTPMDSILYGEGSPLLHDEVAHYAIPGLELLSAIGAPPRFLDPLQVYAPIRGKKVNINNPSASFERLDLYSSGLTFAVHQSQYDGSYILTSLSFARQLFQYTDEVSAIGLRLKKGANVEAFRRKAQSALGDGFKVEDRYEQQADTFKIMQLEKFVSYLFLAFILLIVCFNIIGSLSMLILDKKTDIATLRNMGATRQQITRIFLMEGVMITALGAVIGIVLGVVLCGLQQYFGLIKMGNSGSFIVDTYPVHIQVSDLLLILFTVFVAGVLSVWMPVHRLCQRFF